MLWCFIKLPQFSTSMIGILFSSKLCRCFFAVSSSLILKTSRTSCGMLRTKLRKRSWTQRALPMNCARNKIMLHRSRRCDEPLKIRFPSSVFHHCLVISCFFLLRVVYCRTIPTLAVFSGRLCYSFIYLFFHTIYQNTTQFASPDTEIFHYYSWKPVYIGIERSKVKITSHKNIADVGLFTFGSAGFF